MITLADMTEKGIPLDVVVTCQDRNGLVHIISDICLSETFRNGNTYLVANAVGEVFEVSDDTLVRVFSDINDLKENLGWKVKYVQF